MLCGANRHNVSLFHITRLRNQEFEQVICSDLMRTDWTRVGEPERLVMLSLKVNPEHEVEENVRQYTVDLWTHVL